MKKIKFNVQGMTCSACSAHITKAISRMNGVAEVNVMLLTNIMFVEFDEGITSVQDILNNVKKAGFTATLAGKSSQVKADKEDIKKNLSADAHAMRVRLIVSFGFLIPLMYIAMGGMIGLPIPFFFKGTDYAVIFAFTQFLLALPVVIVNRKYYIVGFKNLIKMRPNMDTLIAVGSGASLIYGVIAIFIMSYGMAVNDTSLIMMYMHDLYFETAVMILALVTLGKFLENISKGKTTLAIEKLIGLAPKTALLIVGNEEKEIDSAMIKVGDILLIKPGATVPVDGVVIEGASSVDESALTGESMPVEKYTDSSVMSATINGNGMMKIRATKVGDDSTLARIIKLVEEASNSKAPIAKLADKVSGIFVPVVMTISLVSFILWLTVGSATINFALSIAIAVLVISCPCALGLATPVAIMVGTGVGASNGILIKSGDSLQLAHKVNTVVLDKTGTITEGKPKVTDVLAVDDYDSNILLRIATALEQYSEHPLASAIMSYAEDNNIIKVSAENFKSTTGKGVQVEIDGEVYYAGNISLMKSISIDTAWAVNNASKFAVEGKTPLIFASDRRVLGIIAVADNIKASSKNAIDKLKSMGLEVIMLTGDNKVTAEAIADQINADRVISEVLPADKEAVIRELQREGKVVAMVGDGVNDAPALARADVGIAIGSGMDIAIESSDIVLMKSDLIDVANAIKLSKKVIINIKENLFWAFIYNIIGIPIAAGALYSLGGFKLDPMIGAAAMSLSSVCVVLNALRLKLFKPYYSIHDKLYNDTKVDTANKNHNENDNHNENNHTIIINSEESNMKKIYIEGMMCGHCAGVVEKTLTAMGNVQVTINLEEKHAIINGDEVSNEVITDEINNAGYKVLNIEEIK